MTTVVEATVQDYLLGALSLSKVLMTTYLGTQTIWSGIGGKFNQFQMRKKLAIFYSFIILFQSYKMICAKHPWRIACRPS